MVDIDRLVDLEPDIIIVHETILRSESHTALRSICTASTGVQPEIVDFAPVTFKQILDCALALGKSVGRMRDAMQVIAQHEQRIRRLHSLLGLHARRNPERRPTALCLRSIEPLVTAGEWIPDMIELAGGRVSHTLCPEDPAVQMKRDDFDTDAGFREPRPVTWEDIRRSDPDTLFFMLDGTDSESGRRSIAQLTASPKGWPMLGAVSEERVYFVPPSAAFNRAGPRLYRGIELLALALYPEMPADHLSVVSQELTKIASPASNAESSR